MRSGRVSSSCSISDTRRVNVKQHEHHLMWKSCWIPVIHLQNFAKLTDRLDDVCK
jgi:hypothetical protein